MLPIDIADARLRIGLKRPGECIAVIGLSLGWGKSGENDGVGLLGRPRCRGLGHAPP